MDHATKGKVIVTEIVSVPMVWYVVVITAGEIFHQKEQYGIEDMIAAMVYIPIKIQYKITILYFYFQVQ
jgi:hypothetical protein